MNLLRTTLMTTALVLGSASAAIAQDAMVDKAKDMAIDKGTDMAKDEAKKAVGDDKARYVDPAAKVGKNMLKGDSVGDAVMGAAQSEAKSSVKGAVLGGTVIGGAEASGMTETTLSTGEAMTAGKVIMSGGSTEDAAIAITKERAKDNLMERAERLVTDELGSSTVVMEDAVVESSTVVTTDPTGVVPPVQATVTTTTTPAVLAPAPVAAPNVPAASTVAVQVNCPSGTTAQPDGTCMITGDYKE